VTHVVLHRRGREPKPSAMPGLPVPGMMLDLAGELWRVDTVVMRQDGLDVYLIRVGDSTAADLRQQWRVWSETVCETECRT
jgi:hypothetical protein